ncbi:hypothetical protein [Cellulomonas sp. PhB150]|uniref:hypothetical protein n=1 Tax=Cellulomonas sp. PhB150 TaxID=2485188 RepID=UPI000F4684C3|nr:hypothetical protein [Cellulomonas sp. PhB150]ROS22931.1 hypothetical protein EDF34_3103 [Cellulomonas sp. PhB150]
MTLDPWAPLGQAGTLAVEDALSFRDLVHLPKATPHAQRCDLQIVGTVVNLSWQHRELVAAIDGREVARGVARTGEGQDTFAWEFTVMPVVVLGDVVEVERQRNGRDRWSLAVRGPGGRAWEWRPGGRLLADRMELTRADEKDAVVTHSLRPVPGHPRSPAGPPTVTWDASASLAEVLLPVMWVLDRTYSGLLPKAQRVVQGDVL